MVFATSKGKMTDTARWTLVLLATVLLGRGVTLASTEFVNRTGEAVPYDPRTRVITCKPNVRANCASPFRGTNTTIAKVFDNNQLHVRVGMHENRSDHFLIWLRPAKRCQLFPWSSSTDPPGCNALFGQMAWDNATKMEIRNVLPDYTTEDEDEWNGWEAREISIYCKEAAQFHNYGEYYITLIFQSDTPNQCGNTFLFPHFEKYGYWFDKEQPPNVNPGMLADPPSSNETTVTLQRWTNTTTTSISTTAADVTTPPSQRASGRLPHTVAIRSVLPFTDSSATVAMPANITLPHMMIGTTSGSRNSTYNGTRHHVYVGDGAGWNERAYMGEFRVYAPREYDTIHFTMYADAESVIYIEAHDEDSLCYYKISLPEQSYKRGILRKAVGEKGIWLAPFTHARKRDE